MLSRLESAGAYSEYENHNIVAFAEGVTPAAAYGDPVALPVARQQVRTCRRYGNWALEL